VEPFQKTNVNQPPKEKQSPFGPMAFCRVLALVALACVGVSGVSYAPKPTSAILAGFNADGFGVVGNVSFNGSRGFVAESYNTTLLSTGAHKLIYYIEGNAYELGYLHGLLAEESVGAMTNTYVDHFLISMISVELDQKYALPCGVA
jgi:hypothetical protein